MLMQTGVDLSETTKKQNAIRQLSSEVCLTVYNFAESPREFLRMQTIKNPSNSVTQESCPSFSHCMS